MRTENQLATALLGTQIKHGNQLPLDRCPHCNIARPLLRRAWGPTEFHDHEGKRKRLWSTYSCETCGSLVLVCSQANAGPDIASIWPSTQTVADAVPTRARQFLTQAIASQHAPAGAVMLTASAVDAMLKEKGYRDGSLNSRIDKAAAEHLITNEMAAWAHEIRLDANDQRHADEVADLPASADAAKVIEFANALAQFLYVLPLGLNVGAEVQAKVLDPLCAAEQRRASGGAPASTV